LNTVITDVNESVKEIALSYEYNEIEGKIAEQVKKRAKNIQVDGFRKGKVPMPVIKKMFGDALEYEAAEKVANELFFEEVKEKDIQFIFEPAMVDLDFKPNEKLEFKVRIEVFPVVNLGQYSGHTLDLPDYKVSDEEVESEIRTLQLNWSKAEPSEEPISGDLYEVTADLVRIDEAGNDVNNERASNQKINLATKKVAPTLIEALQGKKVGDEFSFSNKIHRHGENGEHFDEVVTYKGTLNSISKFNLTELDEEFVKKITNNQNSTLEELRTRIAESIQMDIDYQEDQYFRNKVNDLLLKAHPFTPPPTMVANLLKNMFDDEVKNDKNKKFNQSFDDYAKANFPMAERTVVFQLVKEEIVKKENISISQEVIEKEAQDIAKLYNMKFEDVLPILEKESGNNYRLLDKQFYLKMRELNTIVKMDPQELHNKEHHHHE